MTDNEDALTPESNFTRQYNVQVRSDLDGQIKRCLHYDTYMALFQTC